MESEKETQETVFGIGDIVKWPKSVYKDDPLTVVDYTNVAPGDRRLVGHSQRIKVKDDHNFTSDWVSGGHFTLVEKAK